MEGVKAEAGRSDESLRDKRVGFGGGVVVWGGADEVAACVGPD
jgi:hypothetical protein